MDKLWDGSDGIFDGRDTTDQGPEKVFRTLQRTMETTPEAKLLVDAINTSARREIPVRRAPPIREQ